MRRCKYYYRETWVYPDTIPEYCSIVQCSKGFNLGFRPSNCRKGLSDCYTPVELDPYWKDIFDETNRRLNNA